jgi:hypothetical protein
MNDRIWVRVGKKMWEVSARGAISPGPSLHGRGSYGVSIQIEQNAKINGRQRQASKRIVRRFSRYWDIEVRLQDIPKQCLDDSAFFDFGHRYRDIQALVDLLKHPRIILSTPYEEPRQPIRARRLLTRVDYRPVYRKYRKKILKRAGEIAPAIEFKLGMLNNREVWHRILLSTALCQSADLLHAYRGAKPLPSAFKNSTVPVNALSKPFKSAVIANAQRFIKGEFVADQPVTGHGYDERQRLMFEGAQYQLSRCAIAIVTETVFSAPILAMSEKPLIPAMVKRPFIVVGAAGILRQVRRAGFKTFGQWWDEGYDDITDPAARLSAIYELIVALSKKSMGELTQLTTAMASTLEHNQRVGSKIHLNRLNRQRVYRQ